MDLAVRVPAAVSSDYDVAFETLVNPVKKYLVLERTILRNLKVGFSVPDSLSMQKISPSPSFVTALEETATKVPDYAVRQVGAIGSTDNIIEFLEKLVKEGARHLVIRNFGPDLGEAVRLFGEKVIPYFRGAS